MKADFHMHTSFSTDSDAKPESMIEAAINKGLKTICITDHMDLDFPDKYDEFGADPFVFDLDEYFRTLQHLKEQYAEKIDIRIGMEMGLQPWLSSRYEEMASKYPFDFLIGSVHIVDGTDPYYGEIFENHSDREGYRRTFEVTLECLDRIQCFDTLGHLDYVVRYGKHQDAEYDPLDYRDLIDEILKKLIQGGKALEVNTAGWKYGLPFAHPHPDILKRYRELGGELVTVGADGHKPEQIAYDFYKVKDLLRSCGFKYYTEFCNRRPEQKLLDESR